MDNAAEELLKLHRSILATFKLAVNASEAISMKHVPMEDAVKQLATLINDLTRLPEHGDIDDDLRFMAFRRARILMKAAGENAVLREPAHYILDVKPMDDEMVPQENRNPAVTVLYPSYHDAALKEAIHCADYVTDSLQNYDEARRSDMSDAIFWKARGIPEERRGCFVDIWTRLDAIYEEYVTGMLGEASLAVEPNNYRLLIEPTKPTTEVRCGVHQRVHQGVVYEVPRPSAPTCKCGVSMKSNRGPRLDFTVAMVYRYFKCPECGETMATDQKLEVAKST